MNNILAAIISFFFPGIGQIFQGETKKGIILFIIAIILAVLVYYVCSYVWIIDLIWSIYVAIDAYKEGELITWL